MSVVIAIKEKDHIVMGCDSQVTYGPLKLKTSNKIFNIQNCPQGIMGVAGNLRGAQLLQIQDFLIDEINVLKEKIDFKYCVEKLYNKIYNIFLENRLAKKEDMFLDCEFILAYKDNAFWISSDGCVFEIDDFLVIGSGFETAQAVLLGNKNKSPKTRIKEAVKACAEKTLYVDNNTIFMDTQFKTEE